MRTSTREDVRKLYEATADSYSEMMDTEINHPVYSDMLSRLSERIRHLPGLVVDTSCGSGHMLSLYHARYDPQRLLVAIDLSPHMVEITGKRLGSHAKMFTADMRDLSMISSGTSAAVINFFALHHLDPEQVVAALQEWYRILCAQGQLIIAVWEGVGTIDYGDDTDIVALRYTQDAISAWVSDTGFVVDHCLVEPVEDIPMNAIYLEATKYE